tara:strand:+ start:18811 stop:19458 length:648 start_codon:yes stop_codon:yes gene_type:complete
MGTKNPPFGVAVQGQFRRELMADTTLLMSARLIGVAILNHVGASSGKAWPSMKTLAKQVGCSTRNAQRGVSSLRDRWFWIHRDYPRCGVNSYTPIISAEKRKHGTALSAAGDGLVSTNATAVSSKLLTEQFNELRRQIIAWAEHSRAALKARELFECEKLKIDVDRLVEDFASEYSHEVIGPFCAEQVEVAWAEYVLRALSLARTLSGGHGPAGG